MKTFVINLDNAEDRWSHYKGLDVHRWRATPYDEVSDEDAMRMISYHNVPEKNHLCKTACFLSHLSLWEHIVKHKLNGVLILEDDAMKVNFNLIGLPSDGICYIGGATYTPNMTGKFIKVDNLKDGINEINFDEYRVLMTMSYYIPNYKIANELISMVMTKRRWRAVDVMLGDIQKNEHLKAYLHYPAIFEERPNNSQIQTKSRKKYAGKDFTLQGPERKPSALHQAQADRLISLPPAFPPAS